VNTVPSDFDTVLRTHVQAGYRVLACASRELSEISQASITTASRYALLRNVC